MKGSDTQTNPTRSLHWADPSAAGVSVSSLLMLPGPVAPRPCNVGPPSLHYGSGRPCRLCFLRLGHQALPSHPLSRVAQIPTSRFAEILLDGRFGLQTTQLNQVESMNTARTAMGCCLPCRTHPLRFLRGSKLSRDLSRRGELRESLILSNTQEKLGTSGTRPSEEDKAQHGAFHRRHRTGATICPRRTTWRAREQPKVGAIQNLNPVQHLAFQIETEGDTK